LSAKWIHFSVARQTLSSQYAYCGVEPVTNVPLLVFGVAEVGRAVTILDQTAAAAPGA